MCEMLMNSNGDIWLIINDSRLDVRMTETTPKLTMPKPTVLTNKNKCQLPKGMCRTALIIDHNIVFTALWVYKCVVCVKYLWNT